MKKDILIPEVKEVYIAVVREYNDDYKVFDWNAYIINDKPVALEMVIIVHKRVFRRQKKRLPFEKKLSHFRQKATLKLK